MKTIDKAPQAGIRVLDLSRVLAGPYCTMVLADVTKLERPGVGDETRTCEPPFAGGEATSYLAVNRGKRSIALDLADERTRPVVEQLVATGDVVVENFRAGVTQRLRFDYDSLKELRQDLVYCSITGPVAGEPGRTGSAGREGLWRPGKVRGRG